MRDTSKRGKTIDLGDRLDQIFRKRRSPAQVQVFALKAGRMVI